MTYGRAVANEGAPPVGARHAVLDVGVQIVARILNLALGVVVTLILARALGTSNFGIWSTIFAITQIAAGFGSLGLNQITISRASAQPDREPDWLGALLSLRLLLAIPITLGMLLAVLLIIPTGAGRLAGAILSGLTFVSVPTALSVVFELRVRNHITMAILTLNSIVWGIGVVLVATFSGGITAFTFAFAISAIITMIVTVVFALRLATVRLRGAHRLWGSLLRVGVGVGAAGILVTMYVKLDQVLVFEFAGSTQAGLYGAAYRLLDQIQFIPISVMTTLFPLIASSYPRDRERVRNLLQVAGEYLTMASLPILAFTIVASYQIMTLLFGKQFGPAAPALPVLAGAFVSISFGYLAGNMVVILELQRKFFYYAAIGLVINAVLNVLLIPRYGFMAAAWMTLVTEVTVMSLTMRKVLISLEMRPRLGRLARTFIAALAMGLVVWWARVFGVPLGGLVVFAAISYGLSLLLLGLLRLGEMRAMLQGKQLAVRTGDETVPK